MSNDYVTVSPAWITFTCIPILNLFKNVFRWRKGFTDARAPRAQEHCDVALDPTAVRTFMRVK